MLRLYPPVSGDAPRPPIPDAFLAEAAAWVQGDGSGKTLLTAAMPPVEYPLNPADARLFLEGALASRPFTALLVRGELTGASGR